MRPEEELADDVAETTLIPRAPRGRDEAPVQIARLLHAHEIVLEEARAMARQAAAAGDDGTNDLLGSDVVRTNERRVWFIAEHLVGVGKEFSGRSHLIVVQEGCQEIEEYALSWAQARGQTHAGAVRIAQEAI